MSIRGALKIMMLSICPLAGFNQGLYFPPLTGPEWETESPEAVGWCTNAIDPLYSLLAEEKSKAFLVLYNRRIILEKYFGSFTRDSLWYWASAGKTLTAFLTGMAVEDGELALHEPSAKYLGKGWTSCRESEENEITIWHQLTMTTGLDDRVTDNHCTLDTCLLCLDQPGQGWAYHNAPYTLLRNVLEAATGINENQYIQQKLKSRIGMKGLWLQSGWNNVYFSDARSMARFGLLVLNKGAWGQDVLMRDSSYFQAMTRPSQSLNPSYGYLWWLNGQPSFRLPGLQIDFPGPLLPEAPSDLIAGIGKNGQLLFVVPSLKLVMLRMGESNGNDEVSILLARDLWSAFEKVRCGGTVASDDPAGKQHKVIAFPNPAGDYLTLSGVAPGARVVLSDALGKVHEEYIINNNNILINHLQTGLYYIKIPYLNQSLVFSKH